MTPDLKIWLPTQEEEESPKIYVNKKLVPLAMELHRKVNELTAPRSRSDGLSDIDMIPSDIGKQYAPNNVYLKQISNKSVEFSYDENLDIVRNHKQMRILFSATVFSDNGKPVAFRLVNSKTGEAIRGSEIQLASTQPVERWNHLPYGYEKDRIHPSLNRYHIESRYVNQYARPVVRRFSLSVVYA